MNTKRKLEPAFTVIELLVVITTIGILTSLLLPTLWRLFGAINVGFFDGHAEQVPLEAALAALLGWARRAIHRHEPGFRQAAVFSVEPVEGLHMKTNLTPIFLVLMFAISAAHAQFTYTTNNGTITITGYTGTDDVLVTPSTIEGW